MAILVFYLKEIRPNEEVFYKTFEWNFQSR